VISNEVIKMVYISVGIYCMFWMMVIVVGILSE